MLNPTTTLARIRDKRPYFEGWAKLLSGLGYTEAAAAVTKKEVISAGDGLFGGDRIVSLGDVATTNNALDAMWCVRALDWSDIAVRRAIIAGAVLPAVVRASKHTKDKRVHDAIADLQLWCDGDETIDLEKVRKAAVAADAVAVAYAAEREQQRKDIIAALPPVGLAATPPTSKE